MDIVSKLFNKKHINYAITFISIVYYIYLMFFSDVTLDTGKKELENMTGMVVTTVNVHIQDINYDNIKKDQKKDEVSNVE